MKIKLRLGLLILILTFLGVASQQQNSVANQEIVMQFTDIEASSQEAQNTIAIVKLHLQDIGANNIQVKKEVNGKLKITYYSDADVTRVKETLFQEKKLKINFTYNNDDENDQRRSSEDGVISYNLDIFEIQNTSDVDLGLEGIVLNKKLESDRYYDPNLFSLTNIIDVENEDNNVKISYKVWRSIETSIDNASYIIPEVRAGPLV